ncbi:YDG/SRA domain-containing protein [Streptomyces telluris]|uniref:HNH endonuclease n=1 Tax=Streptomyces telluris TaxID=2720021 RepID=A0A9X2RQI0_9ACTN|nr:YDG/SRA domain-containing protein [Streptomyces telluris]MCQ8774838.1 HNH endonuclease [Streptomyces telluris]
MPDATEGSSSRLMTALRTLHVDRSSGQPARHQPVVLLWAIRRAAAEESRLVPWQNSWRELHAMLKEYGRTGSTAAPEYPFVALHRSPLWELVGVDGAVPQAPGSSLRPWLNAQNPLGGLAEEFYTLLKGNHDLCRQAVTTLHESYFDDYRLELLLLEAGVPLTDFDGYGHPPHVRIGDSFSQRQTLSRARVHRPRQAGICGTGELGAESIVVSGGYEDDEDYGDEIIYTGQGGRDENTKKQYEDQELTLGNAALATSASAGAPVRVIRGAGGDPKFSPETGLRYDGLYRVEEYWSQRGESNFLVWRYRLRAIDARETGAGTSEGRDIAAAINVMSAAPAGNATPGRRETRTQRVIRSTAVADYVKRIHDHSCQVCEMRIETPTGAYSEAAHIRPLGSPHNGPDEIENILCLCPNHHVAFDFGMLTINDDLIVTSHGTDANTYQLRGHPNHPVKKEHLAYHRQIHER